MCHITGSDHLSIWNHIPCLVCLFCFNAVVNIDYAISLLTNHLSRFSFSLCTQKKHFLSYNLCVFGAANEQQIDLAQYLLWYDLNIFLECKRNVREITAFISLVLNININVHVCYSIIYKYSKNQISKMICIICLKWVIKMRIIVV